MMAPGRPVTVTTDWTPGVIVAGLTLMPSWASADGDVLAVAVAVVVADGLEETVGVGQAEVQHDQVGCVAAHLLQALLPGLGLTDVETGPPEHRGDELTDLVGVLHDEHGLFGHDLSSARLSGRGRLNRSSPDRVIGRSGARVESTGNRSPAVPHPGE